MSATKVDTMGIDLKKVLDLHAKWLRGEEDGQRANLQGVDLRKADLRCADLRRADLHCADLRGADIRSADLRGADLHCADLKDANLKDANLKGADLYGADLRGADLNGSNLKSASIKNANFNESKDGEVCRMDFGGWSICVRYHYTSIECQTHPNEKWLSWSPDDVADMHDDAREWWSVHGEAVKAAIRCVMSKRRKT